MPTQKTQRFSILKGEQKLELNEKSKKAFGEFVKRSKSHKVNPNDFTQTIVCGPEEFTETEKKRVKK